MPQDRGPSPVLLLTFSFNHAIIKISNKKGCDTDASGKNFALQRYRFVFLKQSNPKAQTTARQRTVPCLAKLYYLQSRYYDPEVGRFVNADDYIFTNQGLLSLNTFAYCHNNPICCIDKSGTFPWLVVGIAALVVVAIGVDHWLASSQPEGGYAVASESSDNATIKGIYAEGNGFEIGANGMTLCDTEVGLLSCSIEGEYAEIVPFDCFTASASAAVDWSSNPSIEASAVASIYSPSVEVNIPFGFFNITFSAEALIGAAGIGVDLDPMSGKFKITPPTLGIGGTYNIDFNLAN